MANVAPPGEDPVELEITDTLDLHSFPPAEVPDLVRSYVDEAFTRGFTRLKIIHGRGTGSQRRTVRAILSRDDRVVEFSDAPPQAGGWGATCVTLSNSGRIRENASGPREL